MTVAKDVPELIARLWDLTVEGTLQWEPLQVFDAFSATHNGIHYLIDKTDSTPWFSVDGVEVWRGYELDSFFKLIHEKFSPPRPALPDRQPDSRIPDVVTKALERLKTKE